MYHQPVIYEHCIHSLPYGSDSGSLQFTNGSPVCRSTISLTRSWSLHPGPVPTRTFRSTGKRIGGADWSPKSLVVPVFAGDSGTFRTGSTPVKDRSKPFEKVTSHPCSRGKFDTRSTTHRRGSKSLDTSLPPGSVSGVGRGCLGPVETQRHFSPSPTPLDLVPVTSTYPVRRKDSEVSIGASRFQSPSWNPSPHTHSN